MQRNLLGVFLENMKRNECNTNTTKLPTSLSVLNKERNRDAISAGTPCPSTRVLVRIAARSLHAHVIFAELTSTED